MAKCKVCLSTRRIAFVDCFPSGALHHLNLTIFDVRFNDSHDDCYARSESLGHFYLEDAEQLSNVLKCFGLDWCDSFGYDDALEMLATDYEKRKSNLEALFTVQEV